MRSDNLTPDQVPEGQPLPPAFDSSLVGKHEPRTKPREKAAKPSHKQPLDMTIGSSKSSNTGKTAAGVGTVMILRGRTFKIHKEGQIFVIEDPELDLKVTGDLTTALEELNETLNVDWVQAYEEFRTKNGDHYDFVAMIPDIKDDAYHSQTPIPGSMPNFTSHHVYVFNNVTGISYLKGDYYDKRALFHSTRLQGMAAVTTLDAKERKARLHELGHRWGAYVSIKKNGSDQLHPYDLTDSANHWLKNFNCGWSSLGGGTQWVEHSDGSFSGILSPAGDDDDRFAYCRVDLYLMGMLAPKEVRGFYYIKNFQPAPTAKDPNRYSGTRVDLTVDNIIRANGPRRPHAAQSPRSFRLACIVLTKDLASGIKQAKKLQQYRIAVTNQFREATQSRGMLDTYLYDSSYDGIYIRKHELDTGVEPSNGVFWNSPDIWVGNADDGGETHQNVIRGQDNLIYVRVWNSGRTPSRDITVNLFQANPGTEFLYPQDWKWDNRHRIGDSQFIESVPAGDSRLATFKWDRNKILPGTGNPCLLAEILPIHPTQTKLRYVWEDRRIALKNVTVLDPTPEETGLTFPFFIGAHSLPERSVRIRVHQTEGRHLDKVSVDLGKKRNTWLSRLKAPRSLEPRGGRVIEQSGRSLFVIDHIHKGGDITLPLLEATPEKLVFRLNWGKKAPDSHARFEITQLNEQYEIVGGLDLLIRHGRSNQR